MTQPEYVPVRAADEVRPVERLPAPRAWQATRPGDLRPGGAGYRPGPFGIPGPDQGYALRLARQFHGRLVLTEGEDEHDVVAGAVGIGLRRAACFGRAPVIHDLGFAFELWGFLDEAPADLVEYRRDLFRGAGHQYWDQRLIVDQVPHEILTLTPAQVAERRASGWKALLDA